MPPEPTAAGLTKDLAAARRDLYRIVRAPDARALAKRPPSGAWSALEHVRHLLFAEELHYGRLRGGATDFSPLGMTGMRAKRFAAVGTAKPAPALEAVLAAWDDARAANQRALKGRDDERLRSTLDRNTHHVRTHTAAIVRLLRAQEHPPTRRARNPNDR